ncbi:MAG: polymorphic toxin type 46 domain-containing protein [Kofleriaceae bacterium]
MQAQRDTAFDFYRSHGMPEARIDSHLDGIDFRHPVVETTIPRGTIVSQFQVEGGRQGSYYSDGTPTPGELGINPQGQVLGPDGHPIIGPDGNPVIADKVVTRWQATEDIPALQSTAAPITDTWSTPGQPYDAPGGGMQMYAPDRDKFRPVGTVTAGPTPGGLTPGGPTPGGPTPGGPTPGGPTPGGPTPGPTPGGPTPGGPTPGAPRPAARRPAAPRPAA